MFLPSSHTEPAKFISTHLACHVVAPLVLLNWLLTLGTVFSVRQDPGYILALVCIFEHPLGSILAITGCM